MSNEPEMALSNSSRSIPAPRSADHLASLCFAGGASSGTYTPSGTEVRLAGTDRVQDAVVVLHEAHHGSLNDSTAWGTALHVLARLHAYGPTSFRDLLDLSRRTHESYATFASVSITLARHAGAEAVLAAYPQYVPCHRSTLRFVASAGGPHRRYLAATAAARLAMQTPILDTLIVANLAPIPLSNLRELDTPDGRWRWMMRHADSLLPELVAAATREVERTFGSECIERDARGDESVTAEDRFDDAWNVWERVVYDRLASELTSAGATALTYNGHRDAARRIVDLTRSLHPNLGLRVDATEWPAPDDRALAAAAIESVRLHLVPDRWRAAVYPLALTEIVTQRASHHIDNQATLIIDVRLGGRLDALYRWESEPDRRWWDDKAPVVACRLIGDDDGESLVLHCPISDLDSLAVLTSAWSDRGPVVSIVAVSSLIDKTWASQWMPALRNATQQVMLIDVELDRFVRNWAQGSVSTAVIEVRDASGVTRYAAAVQPYDVDILWMFLGDEVSVHLLLQQIRLTADLTFDPRNTIDQQWLPVVKIVATHLLATESFVDLNGLEGHL